MQPGRSMTAPGRSPSSCSVSTLALEYGPTSPSNGCDSSTLPSADPYTAMELKCTTGRVGPGASSSACRNARALATMTSADAATQFTTASASRTAAPNADASAASKVTLRAPDRDTG